MTEGRNGGKNPAKKKHSSRKRSVSATGVANAEQSEAAEPITSAIVAAPQPEGSEVLSVSTTLPVAETQLSPKKFVRPVSRQRKAAEKAKAAPAESLPRVDSTVGDAKRKINEKPVEKSVPDSSALATKNEAAGSVITAAVSDNRSRQTVDTRSRFAESAESTTLTTASTDVSNNGIGDNENRRRRRRRRGKNRSGLNVPAVPEKLENFTGAATTVRNFSAAETAVESSSIVPAARVSTGRKMLLNVVDSSQARVAIIGKNGLEELYTEKFGGEFVHGNIFKGRVVNIQPNLQAAFIDIGSEKNAFLHAEDIIPPFGGYEDVLRRRRKKAPSNPQHMKVSDMLVEGQELLVQITREALPTKGPSVTTYISLPGRYLVLMPSSKTRGVSKKITDQQQRKVLRQALEKLSPPQNLGFIIRTAGMGKGTEELQLDLDALTKLWQEIADRAKTEAAPRILYRENELTIRAIRDYCREDIDELFIDRRDEYARAVSFIKLMMPDFYQRTRLYDRKEPLFTAYKVEDEIGRLFEESVKLPSGGEILLQQTEALVAIDVNTSKFVKANSTRDMIKKINLEAAEQIARQLRLRDMGGLVMIDFIDMEHAEDRKEVEEAMRLATRLDRARITLLPISQLGIMEMTRQRLRQSLHLVHYQNCPLCGGSGKCRKPESLGAEFMRKLRGEIGKKKNLLAAFNPHSALFIANELRQKLGELEQEHGVKITITADDKLTADQFTITPLDS